MPRGTTSTPMPPARPPPPTGTTMACTSGSCARISRASRPPLPAMTWSSSKADTKTTSSSSAARRARGGLGLVVRRARDLDLGAQRRDAGALDLGRLRRDEHGRVDAERLRGERDAEAVIAGRGGDDALGRRRAPASMASAASRAAAPRSLNEPVRCRFSSLSQTSAPVRRPSAGAGTSGVTRVRRRTRSATAPPVTSRQISGSNARSMRRRTYHVTARRRRRQSRAIDAGPGRGKR